MSYLDDAALSYFSSSTAVANTPGLPDGVGDLVEKVRRDGFIGVGVDASSAIHTTSFGSKAVNYFGPGAYSTSSTDYTLRFAQGCPIAGVNLHVANTCPGQILEIVNSSTFAQPITAITPLQLNGVGFLSELLPGGAIKIQSIGGFWCIIDQNRTDKLLKNVALGTALVDGIIAIGPLRFTYNGTTTSQNIGIQSTTATPVPFIYAGHEQFPGPTAAFATGSLTAPAISSPTWLAIPLGGVGINEFNRVSVVTATAHYRVECANFGDTRISLFVEQLA